MRGLDIYACMCVHMLDIYTCSMLDIYVHAETYDFSKGHEICMANMHVSKQITIPTYVIIVRNYIA